jgi:hypothetical protein
MTITSNEYSNFQGAYDYFNACLFEGKLPPVMITLQHGKKYYGYAWKDKFIERAGVVVACEIALNPDLFDTRSDKVILSTLVHEMCHVWQFVYGKAGRNGYHNKQWGDKMKAIGLYPSSTGNAGGKETGQKVSHYIIKDSLFDNEADRLINECNFVLNWQSSVEASKAAKKKQTRAKFVCPECNQAAWAKPTARLVCFVCTDKNWDEVSMVEMVCTTQNDDESEAA